jgi:hypothetical protein
LATPLASAASCDEARRDCPTIVHCGEEPSAFTISATMCDTSSWLPATETPMVSMKAIRARSITSGGTCLMSKPTTKSASICRSRRPEAAALPPSCCADAAVPVGSSASAPVPARNRRRSNGCAVP